jgi:hypothetical protein
MDSGLAPGGAPRNDGEMRMIHNSATPYAGTGRAIGTGLNVKAIRKVDFFTAKAEPSFRKAAVSRRDR